MSQQRGMSSTARRPDASSATVVKRRSGPIAWPFVTAASASYSTNGSGAPAPAVSLGGSAAIEAGVAASADSANPTLINRAAGNGPLRLPRAPSRASGCRGL